LQYGIDVKRVEAGEMSFRDFFDNLQNERYWVPSTFARDGSFGFCSQVKFPDEVAASITSLETMKANESKREVLRVRQVGSGFSGGTKAKFTLSIPVTFEYTLRVTQASPPVKQWRTLNIMGKTIWLPVFVPGPVQMVPVTKKVEVKTITLFHPCPIRLNNIQYDAVMTFNDPADRPEAVIMVPLQGTNLNGVEERFLNKIVKFLTTIGTPDPVTGLYQQSDVSVGNDWNLKNVFILDEPQATTDGTTTTSAPPLSPVLDGLYSWEGANAYERFLELVNGTSATTPANKALLDRISQGQTPTSPTTLTYGWRPAAGQITKYILLAEPVGISQTDLGILLRNLPPTPVDEAIHVIPTTQPISYKGPTGRALNTACGAPKEHMTNPGDILSSAFATNPTEDMLSAVFASGSATDLLADTQTGVNDESCDPFARNASLVSKAPVFTPMSIVAFLIQFLILVSIVFGIWVAMYLVTKDYDYSYQSFSEQAGKVIGVFAKQASGSASAAAYSVKQALPSFTRRSSAAPPSQ
jgi:hypothetical protein